METQMQLYEIFRPFARMVAEELANMQKPVEIQCEESKQYRGLKGIMEIFKCGRKKALEIKNSGIIDSAITKVSPKIFLVDEQKALQAMDRKMKGGRRY